MTDWKDWIGLVVVVVVVIGILVTYVYFGHELIKVIGGK